MPEGDIYSTGKTCPESAVYLCQTCKKQEIPLTKGETFPPCATDKTGVNWKNIRSLA